MNRKKQNIQDRIARLEAARAKEDPPLSPEFLSQLPSGSSVEEMNAIFDLAETCLVGEFWNDNIYEALSVEQLRRLITYAEQCEDMTRLELLTALHNGEQGEQAGNPGSVRAL